MKSHFSYSINEDGKLCSTFTVRFVGIQNTISEEKEAEIISKLIKIINSPVNENADTLKRMGHLINLLKKYTKEGNEQMVNEINALIKSENIK